MVIEKKKKFGVCRGSNFPVPQPFYDALLAGKELGDVMDEAFNTVNIKQQGGAIGLLTNHLATRESTYIQALTLAMAPFLHPSLFNQ